MNKTFFHSSWLIFLQWFVDTLFFLKNDLEFVFLSVICWDWACDALSGEWSLLRHWEFLCCLEVTSKNICDLTMYSNAGALGTADRYFDVGSRCQVRGFVSRPPCMLLLFSRLSRAVSVLITHFATFLRGFHSPLTNWSKLELTALEGPSKGQTC